MHAWVVGASLELVGGVCRHVPDPLYEEKQTGLGSPGKPESLRSVTPVNEKRHKDTINKSQQ